jgi:hypothetical protein
MCEAAMIRTERPDHFEKYSVKNRRRSYYPLDAQEPTLGKQEHAISSNHFWHVSAGDLCTTSNQDSRERLAEEKLWPIIARLISA